MAFQLQHANTQTLTSTPEHHFGGPYLYCQPFVLPPRLLLLLLLLMAPPQLLLLLFLFGVTAVARPSSFPSLSETFRTGAGSPPCILTPKFICPSRARGITCRGLLEVLSPFLSLLLFFFFFYSECDLRPRLEWKPSAVQKTRTRISTLVQTFKEHRSPSDSCLSRTRTRTDHPARGLVATHGGAAGRRGRGRGSSERERGGKDGRPRPRSPGARGLTSGLGRRAGRAASSPPPGPQKKGPVQPVRRFPPQPQTELGRSRSARRGSGRRRRLRGRFSGGRR